MKATGKAVETVTETVTKSINTSAEVTLTLDLRETVALINLLNQVGGHPHQTVRGMLDEINNSLLDSLSDALGESVRLSDAVPSYGSMWTCHVYANDDSDRLLDSIVAKLVKSRTEQSTLPPVRMIRYRHTGGFQDNTRYLEYIPSTGRTYLVSDHACRRAEHYTFEVCEGYVASGIWTKEEIR